MNKEQFYTTNQQLLGIIDFLPDATLVIDRDKKVVAWNRAIEEMTGVSKADIIGKGEYAYAVPFYGESRPTLIDLIFLDDLATELKYKNFVREGHTIYGEVFIQLPFNKNEVFLWAKASPLFDSEGNLVGAIESIRDITERKQAEKELRKHHDQFKELTLELLETNKKLQMEINKRKLVEEELNQFFDLSLDIFCIADFDFYFKRVNPAFEKTLGYKKEELLAKPFIDFIHPEDQAASIKAVQELTNGIPLVYFENRYICKNGFYKWLAWTGMSNIEKRLNNFVARNITERKQMEKALRLSDERFYKAFNASPNPMAISTISSGRYIEVNNSFINVLGYSRKEVIGYSVMDLNIFVEPMDRAEMVQIIMEQGIVHNHEISFLTKSGEVRVGLFSADIIELNSEQCLLTVVVDITERKQIEKEMAHLERLNLVGEMAAGIGHEIRNPMTTVRGFLQMYKRKDSFVRYKDNFDLMIEELDRANSIITEFLTLARNKPVDLKPQNLNHIVQTIFPLIQADALNADKYIELELVEIPDILLDEKEIRQMVHNLVRNGLEAMTAGGKLIIRTFIINDDVVLLVQDQGGGIAPDIIEKLGTPFFTTKENGTGLGLAVCYSIANRHSAKIEVDTGSTGTAFNVRFMQNNQE